MTPLPALAFGLVLGARHATDADHLAAVSTLLRADASARRAFGVGAWWGIGHSVSVLFVGGTLVLFRVPMPVRMALALEFLAALMLVALGLRSLATRATRATRANPASLKPLAIGVVHGLAGSAVLALLVLGATTTAAGAAAYLAAFCVGTVAGMAAVSTMFAMLARLAPAGALRLDRAVRIAAGVASVAIGLALAHRVGVRDGLFAAAAAPVVTPE